jgi:hypothetical protein
MAHCSHWQPFARHNISLRRARITSRTGLFEEVNIMNDVPANGSKVVR